jgi:hypothetical protein
MFWLNIGLDIRLNDLDFGFFKFILSFVFVQPMVVSHGHCLHRDLRKKHTRAHVHLGAEAQLQTSDCVGD